MNSDIILIGIPGRGQSLKSVAMATVSSQGLCDLLFAYLPFYLRYT